MRSIDTNDLSLVCGAGWMSDLAKEVLYDLGAAALEAIVSHQVEHWGGTPDYEAYNAMGDYTGGSGNF